MKKIVFRITLGIISSIVIMAFLFYFFLFLNPINIHESNSLKWIPILIAIISLYASGKINKDTPIKFLPLLFIPFVVFKLFNFVYFPFILVLILTGILTIMMARNSQSFRYSNLVGIGILGIFLFFLFTQPLIIEKEGFGYDDDNELVNASILWDFSKKEDLKLSNHNLLDSEGKEYDMINIEGKTHFITFWATWCAPCLEVKPDLEKLKKELEHKTDIEFIDVSFDDDKNKWIEYLEENGQSGKQLISPNQQVTSRALNFNGLPMYFIVDSDGVYNKYRSYDIAQKTILKRMK